MTGRDATRAPHRGARSTMARRMAAGLLALSALSACTSGDVMELRPQVDIDMQTSAAIRPEIDMTAAPDPVLAGYPRADEPAPMSEPPAIEPPTVEPPMMEPPMMEPMSADELTCRKQLKKLKVTFRELDPIRDSASCYIDHPIKVSRIGGVDIKPAATLNCEMAEAFASWTRNELVPASRWRFLSGVKAIHQGSSYSCRRIAGTRGTPSEHSLGNAIDVMKIELNNGKKIDVRKPGLFAFRKRGLLNTVRADGCEYFTTVLGPGYNADHADHFHFDIKSRRNGYRACR
jgi:hypothetical protein